MQADTSTPYYDVAVLGGGLAGLTLAIQIKRRRPATSVIVLEKGRRPAPEAAHKVGESSVEIGAHYFGETLGLRAHIEEHQLPKYGLRFYFRAGGGGAGAGDGLANGLEVGPAKWPPAPSYQLDRGKFENYLLTEARSYGVEVVDQARVESFELRRSGRRHDVEYLVADQARSLSAAWVVDAAGRAGLVKRRLGLAETVGHAANAAWFRVNCLVDIDEFSDDPQWRASGQTEGPRYLSTNHLMGAGYWVWLIPLSSGSTSIGIVADPALHPLNTYNSMDKALDWLERHQPECAATIKDKLASGAEVQDFLAVKHYAHGCRTVFSVDRWALTGDAGVFLDPFYSPGSDFIAISNTYITDLIGRDLDGEKINSLAPFYQRMYFSFFHNGLSVYEGMYPLWGNPRVMPVKVTWDYLFYWAVIGLIVFNGILTDLEALVRVRRDLDRAVLLNRSMQEYFLAWHEVDEPPTVNAFLNQSANATLVGLNRALLDARRGEEFDATLRSNLKLLEGVAAEIVVRSGKSNPGLADRFARQELCGRADQSAYMEETFSVLGM
jgi:flavin-dependent dehydrogenase